MKATQQHMCQPVPNKDPGKDSGSHRNHLTVSHQETVYKIVHLCSSGAPGSWKTREDGTRQLRLKSSMPCHPGLDPKADQEHAGCVSASEEIAKYLVLGAL